MIIMSTVSHHQQQLKRTHSDHHDDHYYHPQQHQLTLSTINCPTKNIRQIKNSCEEEEKLFNHQRCKRSSCDWSLNHRKKIKRTSEKRASQLDDNDDEHFHSHQYHCFVFLKFYSSTLKCSIDVLVKSNDQLPTDLSDDQQSILIGKSRISRSIKPGVIRIRLVSSLFKADADVHEDPSLIKLETIRNSKQSNHFDKQFALLFTNDRFGPGVIGKLFIESLDPQTGSYTNNSPIFELNLTLASEQKILLTSFDQKINSDSICVSSLSCGCVLSSDSSRMTISDKCNLKFNNTKLMHRLAEPLRCQWKSIGRELFPCFNETDLTDFHQSYFITEGNQECMYQLLREWFNREPEKANIRYLLTRLKLPIELIVTIHNDVVIPYVSSQV